MHAVFLTGGQQFRVKKGQTVKVEKLELETGSTVDFDTVLLASDGETVHIGKPYVANAKVIATVVSHGRRKKIKIVKFRRRKHYRKHQGHRQWFTELMITDIQSGSK